MIIYRTPALLRWLYPGLLWRMPVGENKLYLTFDDGPIPELTPWILEVLARQNVKATFFCVGDNVQKHPTIFEETRAAGHELANHTYHHVKGWQMSTANYLKEVAQCDEVLAPLGERKKRLFRPPYGRISRKQIAQLLPHYEIVMWDVLTADYDSRQSPQDCLRNSLQSTRDGSIVVFHDNVKASNNIRYALEPYIAGCLEQGYTFHTL